MSRLRWAVVWGCVALAFVLAVVAEPRSYAHLVLTGQCSVKPMPSGCIIRGGRGGW